MQITVREGYSGFSDIVNDQPIPDVIKAVYVGSAGDIVAEDRCHNAVYFKAVPIGIFYIRPGKVLASGGGHTTTATNLVALY